MNENKAMHPCCIRVCNIPSQNHNCGIGKDFPLLLQEKKKSRDMKYQDVECCH